MPVEGLEAHVTSSGLKYYDIKVGDGAQPNSGALVSVHYTGWLTDGTVFDSSRSKDRPFQFRTSGGVIQGWIEGVSTMRVGGLRRLEIPSKLAYGERGSGKKVPPNSDLVFEVELLEIERQAPAMTPVEGVTAVKTESGLQYWDIKQGEGDPPGMDGRVAFHFTVWTEDGRMLATSTERDQPYSGAVSKLLPGWSEGVSTMKPGGKRRLLVPWDLLKESRGVPQDEDLIFELDLLEVMEPIVQRSIEGIEAVTTESGLKYWDIKAGDGPEPSATSLCRVHYSGWLTDGTMFDSSVEKGQPFTFSMQGGVIQGWLEGAKGMKVGGIRRLEIPPDLGYGPRGAPPVIPGDATLIFEIELLGIEDQPAPPGMDEPESGEE